MFLARKRVALSREEDHEESLKEGRAATEAELLPVIQELRERLRKLESGSGANPNP